MAESENKKSGGKKGYVVLHDMVSYTHPESDRRLPGAPVALAFATRGNVLNGEDSDFPEINDTDAKRLVKLGAITSDHDDINAQLALRGERPDTKQSLDMIYMGLRSPQEAIRAAKAVGSGNIGGGAGPRSNPKDLARLDINDLKLMAASFGCSDDIVASDDKAEIIDALTGKGEGAEDPQERIEREQRRDADHLAARETGGESGRVAAVEGASDEPKSAGRRSSRAQKNDTGDRAES